MALVQLKIKKGIKVYDDGSASIKIAGLSVTVRRDFTPGRRWKFEAGRNDY